MAKKSTFIMLDRNIQEWRWYTKGNTFRVFIHLLLNANIKPKGFEGIVIDRGQLATSHESISKSLNLSVQEVRTAIKHLKTTGEITITRRPNFQVITVTNYNTYQSNQQSSNNHLTINQQSSNNQSTIEQQQSNNSNNYNNVYNGENERSEAAQPHSPTAETPLRGSYKNVRLTDDEFEAIKKRFPSDWGTRINRLSKYMADSKKTYASHYDTIIKWGEQDKAKDSKRKQEQPRGAFDVDDAFEASLERARQYHEKIKKEQEHNADTE